MDFKFVDKDNAEKWIEQKLFGKISIKALDQ